MDTSETYIKMCKWGEIQELWKPSIGDWFYKEDGIGYGLWLVSDVQEIGEAPYLETVLYCSGKRMHESPFGLGLVEFRDPEGYIWLPRQDQLQEIYSEYIGSELELVPSRSTLLQGIIDFAHWLDIAKNEGKLKIWPTNDFASGEQLWLAFVMKEKYNKVWNGEKWLKQ